MSKDGKDKAAQEPREIPIDGADEVTEGAAEAAAPGPEAEPAETAEAAEAEADSIEEEAEAVVADAERVAKAEAEAAAMRDKSYLRLQAEWDNYRKRTAEEAGEMRVRAAEKLMGDIAPCDGRLRARYRACRSQRRCRPARWREGDFDQAFRIARQTRP